MTEISHELWMKSVIGRELSEADARELFLVSKREKFPRDAKLFDEGDPAVAFFLIVEGEVDIEKRGEADRVSTIATLSAGAVVGEMSLLTGESRSAAARVTSASATVLQIDWADFQRLMSDNRAAAFKIIYALARLLAHRLKRINLKVAELTTAPDATPGAHDEKLEEFAKFKAKLFRDWSF